MFEDFKYSQATVKEGNKIRLPKAKVSIKIVNHRMEDPADISIGPDKWIYWMELNPLDKNLFVNDEYLEPIKEFWLRLCGRMLRHRCVRIMAGKHPVRCCQSGC